MTKIKSIGASSAGDQWEAISWPKARLQVYRLQMRIAKAERERKTGKVKALQRILTHSFYAKAIAVKRVTQNKGATTPGVDNIIWRTNVQKMKAALSLKRRGYKTSPLKRIHIAKKSGGLRPLSIPTLQDRAMQALYLQALEPIAENRADINSYGFRPKRSAKDAIEQCHKVLAKRSSAQWIFEGDIESCFDKIRHSWLLENIPMDKTILRKFLEAGYMEKTVFNPTIAGTPQGGICSPTLALMALSGLEREVKTLSATQNRKVNVVVYADDFVITSVSKEVLETSVVPAIERFLKERGLKLSSSKSKITHISKGFDFLGFNIRKYSNKLLIKPSKDSVKSFTADLKSTIKKHQSAKTENLIYALNPKIRGWANYFRNGVSSKTFSKIDVVIYQAIARWINRRHPNKGKKWSNEKYFRNSGLDNWQFFANTKDKSVSLLKLRNFNIKRHVKIKGKANPYDPEYKKYFAQRKDRKVLQPGYPIAL
mgnify:CR=1 FL=1